MDDRRIAHFVSEFENGGVLSFVTALAHAHAQCGYKVYVCSLGKNRAPSPENGNGVQYLEFGYQNNNTIALLSSIVRFLRREHIAILHAHPGTLSRVAGILAGVPVILSTLHGSWSRVNFLTQLFHRWLARHTTALVANSSFTRGYFTGVLGLKEARLRTIYNGVDLERYSNLKLQPRTDILRGLNLSLDARIVVYAGRLHPDKGLNVLIEATRIVKERVANLELLIIGTGNLRAVLESQVGQSKLADTVHFIEALTDVRPILGIADLCVLPSTRREGFGLVLVEAMALGIPVVGSDLGGIPEIITNGVNGCLVAPGDVQALAKTITTLINSPAMARQLALSARQTVAERFSLVRMAQEYLELYETALKQANVNMHHE